jgi:hypothetical protein
MSATRPPTPDGEGLIAGYASSNGASANIRNERARRLVALGYITAVALPLIGLVLGFVVTIRLTKPYSKHGPWIIVLSIIALIVWALVFASGALTSTSNELT